MAYPQWRTWQRNNGKMYCLLDIYEDSNRHHAAFCKVRLGGYDWSGDLPEFHTARAFEIPLNGTGYNKARTKTLKELQHRGLEVKLLRILNDTENSALLAKLRVVDLE